MKVLKLFVLLLLLGENAISNASDIGKIFPSEKYIYIDKVTGVPITVLTNSKTNDKKLYPTHPQWTYDGKYIIFRSNDRSSDGNSQAFAVNENTGEIIQLTDGEGVGTGSLNVARLSNKLYYFRLIGSEKTLIELNLDLLFNDSYAKAIKDKSVYERKIAILPKDLAESGGFTLDADETKAYVGVKRLGVENEYKEDTIEYRVKQVPSGLRSINIETGKISTIIDVPFTMGHVQANPFISGEILYCQETGEDAPQRMWIVNADGTGNRPLYEENPNDWVTHEAWIDKDHVYFLIMGHLNRLRKKPSGLFSINVRTNELQVLGQLNYGSGFWHCGGTTDGKWAVVDNFEGEVYLVNCKTGERTLLTTNHVMKPDHTHPSFSPDNKRVYIQSGHISNGDKLDLMIINVPSYMEF